MNYMTCIHPMISGFAVLQGTAHRGADIRQGCGPGDQFKCTEMLVQAVICTQQRSACMRLILSCDLQYYFPVHGDGGLKLTVCTSEAVSGADLHWLAVRTEHAHCIVVKLILAFDLQVSKYLGYARVHIMCVVFTW